MTATIDLGEPSVAGPDIPTETPQEDPLAGPDYPPYAEIPIERLELNPHNVRPLDEYDINDDYVQTIKDLNGPENDLVVFPSPTKPAMFWPHDGNRRLLGSQTAGLKTLWCRIKPELAHDRRAMLIGQLTTSHQHKPLSEGATADALFRLEEMGVSRDQLRRASGWKREQVNAAIKAGGVSEETRTAFSGIRHRPPTVQEAAVLAEVEDDPDAKSETLTLIRTGHSAHSAVDLVKRRRAEAATMARLMAELQAAGVPITEDMPDGAVTVWRLVDDDGAEMTQGAHATCPGHGAYFPSRTKPTFYCATPEQHGYTVPKRTEPPQLPVKHVREGNTAWRSSGELRHKWLKQRLNSRTDPGQVVLRAVTRLLAIEMPSPLTDKFGSIHRWPFCSDLIGDLKSKQVATAPTARLAWMLLARVAATMEHWLTQNSYSTYLWRPDRSTDTDRKIVADWFALCEELGHTLTPIEKTLRNGIPYSPDSPADPGTTVTNDTAGNDGDLDAEVGDDGPLNDENFAGDNAEDGDFADGDLDEADVDCVDGDHDVADTPINEHMPDTDALTSGA